MRSLHVIKIGGGIVDSPEQLDGFLAKFASLPGHKILVHGGGKIATRLAEDMGIPVTMIDGRRVTDAAMLDVVTMVYAGLSNKKVITGLQKYACNALGLTGADGNLIQAVKRPVERIDYGYVGDLFEGSVNTSGIVDLLNAGFVPVFSALTHDKKGQLLNTNADTIASSIAVALSKEFDVSLVYCFDKLGVLRDVNKEDSLIPLIPSSEFENLKNQGVIHEGMIPKLYNAFQAIASGVEEVYIGRADRLEELAEKNFGTRLIA